MQDSWKAMPNLTVNGGIRFEHNSNPICTTNCFARLAGRRIDAQWNTTLDTPIHQMIRLRPAYQALNKFQAIAFEPRAGFAYSPFGADSKTVIRGGAGFFADSFPAQLADETLKQSSDEHRLHTFGAPIEPSVPGSASAVAAASAAAFNSAYASGGSFNSISAATGGVFAAPNIISPMKEVYYPSYEEWSLQVEQEVAKNTSVSVAYVGNHGYKEPVLNNSANAFGFFNLQPAAPVPSFLDITQVYSGASSNYNGLIASVVNRSRYVTLQFNYEWSHALDEISNGGFDPFGSNGQPFGAGQSYEPRQQLWQRGL